MRMIWLQPVAKLAGVTVVPIPSNSTGLGKKINYRIHTDAIKDTLIPPSITKAKTFKERGRLAHIIPLHFSVSDFQTLSIYPNALFGQTAKQLAEIVRIEMEGGK